MERKTNEKITLGVIIGNRDFFPDKLVGECRTDLLEAFAKTGIKPIMLEESATKLGGVETFQEAQKCDHGYIGSAPQFWR
jgi:L-fucose isomerase-like protein